MQLEAYIRRFIDYHMTRELMQSGRSADCHPTYTIDGRRRRVSGLPRTPVAGGQPLIAYADFTDYHLIVCRRDNWREVFSAFFQREENVWESFQRLHLIRLDTMHARPITQDDE
ncbi:hypothetical protein HBA54_17840 [Pelagibius litoralis]|uniref:Uncharacterized protein n=1 Tax=Pelagibius litoralis TaxID=374515 RepID=A0A967EZU4_9PROT|nr:hypothetical protein [Pelagibius litoralis]NIA70462.1 hypothetical protein [Pelagibius litoralis]